MHTQKVINPSKRSNRSGKWGFCTFVKPIFQVIYSITYEERIGYHQKRVKRLSAFAPIHVLSRAQGTHRPRLAKSASRIIKQSNRKTRG